VTRPAQPTSSRRRSPLVLALIGLVILGALAAAGGLAYLFLRGAPPPAVGLGSPSPGASAASASIGPLPSGAASTVGPAGLDGTWTIDTSIGSFSDFSSSFVGYRVEETLANVGANTAVGRTPEVSGSLVLDGTKITSVEVTAQLSALQSDDPRRDGQLRNQAIETSRFATATFKLTSPIDLGSVPAEGQTLNVTATGDLTLHGVTRSVAVPLAARLSGDVVTVTGSIPIVFADYAIQRPTSFIVLSIEDHGIMELQLNFRHG
jgi:polyisoprenoid-binding protein YceI